jgi:uncharacterized membrane protein
MKNLISRIRWNVVISIIAVIILIVIAVLFFRPFTPQSKCSNGLCIRSYMEPGEVDLRGESTLWVDIRNRGGDDQFIDVKLKTRNVVLFFEETKTQEVGKDVELGSGESIKLNFNVNSNASYPGTFRIDITALYEDKQINDEVYLKLS